MMAIIIILISAVVYDPLKCVTWPVKWHVALLHYSYINYIILHLSGRGSSPEQLMIITG